MLVAYDLNRRGQNYKDILSYIKQHDWAKLSESSYLIDTTLSAEQVRDYLINNTIDRNDNVYVMTVGNSYAGYGPSEVNEWLEQRLG